MFISSVGDEHFVCCASSNFHQKSVSISNLMIAIITIMILHQLATRDKISKFTVNSDVILRAAMFLSGLSVGPFTVVLLHQSTQVLQFSIVSRQKSLWPQFVTVYLHSKNYCEQFFICSLHLYKLHNLLLKLKIRRGNLLPPQN